MARKKGRGPVRLVEPVSLPGLSLGDVLLGLDGDRRGPAGPDTGRRRFRRGGGRPGAAAAHAGRAGRARAAARRLPALGPRGRARVPRVVTRREGKALACKLYRVEEGRALYAGVLKAAGARAFVEAVPGAEFRYRNVPLRRMTRRRSRRRSIRPGLRLRPARRGGVVPSDDQQWSRPGGTGRGRRRAGIAGDLSPRPYQRGAAGACRTRFTRPRRPRPCSGSAAFAAHEPVLDVPPQPRNPCTAAPSSRPMHRPTVGAYIKAIYAVLKPSWDHPPREASYRFSR